MPKRTETKPAPTRYHYKAMSTFRIDEVVRLRAETSVNQNPIEAKTRYVYNTRVQTGV